MRFIDTVTPGPIPVLQSDKPGSIAWKLHHGERVNLLLLGYGGSENDAPYLTDTIMLVTLDPSTHRVVEASIPRDLYGQIDAWQKGEPHFGYKDKINAAFMVGTEDTKWGDKLAPYRGRDGGGHLAETEVAKYTGIKPDAYAAVDFKAFRDVVDALGGIDVCLSSPLDDYSYPDYHDHYIKGGIHFKAGCQHLDGERALELARSRKAIQPDQQTDFGRARRQQMLLSAIKDKALSVNGLIKAPFLMNALENDFRTDMTVSDMRAAYDYVKQVPESAIVHVALTDQNLLDVDTCGPYYLYTLCPEDPSLAMLHEYFANDIVPAAVLREKAPIAFADASYTQNDIPQRLTGLFTPLGFHVATTGAFAYNAQTVVYDFSGGKYPQTAAWLAQYFHAQVKPAPPALAGLSHGLVVAIGRGFALRWYGRAQ